MVTFNIKVYTSAAKARLGKALKKIEKAGFVTTKDLVNIGKDKAKILVPKGNTGWLYKTIQGKVTGTGANVKGRIYLSPVIVPNDGIHRSAQAKDTFSLAFWMHKSPRAKHWFHNGSNTFMYDTKNYLRSKKKGVAMSRFNSIKL